jgi:glutamine amidotransferase
MIAIIDYDMGNLKSVSKAVERVGGDVCVTRDPKKIKSAEKVILPGVGAFGKCMENLVAYGLVEPIQETIASGKNFLGICLGLQLLFEESEEFGPVKGLGILKGRVKRFQSSSLKIPHMGWNQLQKKGDPLLLKNIPDQSAFYFVHSFYVTPSDPNIISTTTDYAGEFSSSIQKDNIFACQFHPEKSQQLGLKMLENFVNLP